MCAQYVSFDDIPMWMQDNEFIETGYRKEMNTKDALLSIFKLHNETCNIWSHLIPLFVFIGMWIRDMSTNNNVVLSIFYFGAIMVFFASVSFHTFICHKWHIWMNKFDYLAIVIAFCCSTSAFCILYFCGNVRIIYLCVVVLLTLISGVFVTLDYFQHTKFRMWRAITFIILGTFNIIPFIHYSTYKYYSLVMQQLTAWALSFTLGAIIYACRIPERWSPSTFDIFLHSHQLFHIFVVIGFVFQLLMVKTLSLNAF